MSLDTLVPQDTPIRLVNQIVDKLDIIKIIDTYKGGGTSAYHQRMMLKIVLYSYLSNIYSCRKIENTFVWKKSVEKNRAKLEAKIKKILEQVEDCIAQDNNPDDGPRTPVNSEELQKRIAQINREHLSKEQQKSMKTLENKHLPKLEITYYEAKNCALKCLCHKVTGNRKIEINHNLRRHKETVRKLLTSKEGLYHRRKRPIEPEAVFSQSKSNKQYERFRHFGKDKVLMEFGLFAVAFNIAKLWNKAGFAA